MLSPIHRGLTIICALAISACGPDSRATPDYHVRFATPVKGAVLRGLADVRLDIAIPEPAEALEIGVEGEPATVAPSMTNTLRLDTRRIENGKRKLHVSVTGISGERWSDSLEVTIRNPEFDLVGYTLNEARYYKGRTVLLQLKYPIGGLKIAADFAAADGQFDPRRVTTRELGGGNYEVSYTLSRSDSVAPGLYEIAIGATNATNETASSRIPLRLSSGPQLPISIENAVFVDGDVVPVSVSTQSAPVVTQVNGPSQLVSGLPQVLEVQWTQSEEHPADRLFVRAAGHSGYYVVPISGVASQASVPVNFQFAQIGSDNNRGTLDLSFAVADGLGAIGGWIPHPILYQLLSPFGAHATLSWNSAADLDLRVTTPTGATISYGSRSADGGVLELDANGMCRKSELAAERIFWAPGGLMPGRYTVGAEIYDACGTPGADYSVALFFCGKTQTITGRFSAADAKTSAGKKTIATIEVDCVNHVYGTVSFEQLYNQMVRSPNDLAALVPIRAISSLPGNLLLAETTTDRAGKFDLYLPIGTGQDYYLEVESSFTPSGASSPFVRVTPKNSSAAHFFRVPGLDTSKNLDTEQNVLITVAQGSGALNIVNRIEQAYDWVHAHFSAADARKVAPVNVRWSFGEDSPMPPVAPGQGSPTPPFRSYWLDNVIYMGGLPNDTNEHDDPVVVHEFFHHVWSHLGIPVVGGVHKSNERTMPALALSEATATALGQQALGYPFYWDSFGSFVFTIDLETRGLPDVWVQGADLGTSDGTITGNVNETLVGAVMWDLMDPLGGEREPTDEIDATYSAMLGSLAHHLPLATRADRGAPGPDLVDLLDGWRCRRRNPLDDVKLKVLLAERQFNYDFNWFACP